MLSQSRYLSRKVLLHSRKILSRYALESRFSTTNKPKEEVKAEVKANTEIKTKENEHKEHKQDAHPKETPKHEPEVHKHPKPAEDPRIEIVNTPPRKRGRFRKFIMGAFLFGTASLGLELMRVANEKFKFEESNVSFMKEDERDAEFMRAGCEERIRNIREVLNQELVSDFKSSQSNYEQALQSKKNEIQQDLNQILNTNITNDSEKYEKIVNLVDHIEDDVSKLTTNELKKKADLEANIEKLAKIKLIIEKDLSDLTAYFNELSKQINDAKQSHFSSLISELSVFNEEFNAIKSDDEVTAISYLFKLKELIAESEDHIDELDSQIPLDLKSVSKETKEKLFHLRFSIREYFRDLKLSKGSLAAISKYTDRSTDALKRIKNHKLTVGEEAEIQRLSDEKEVLQLMISKVKDEIQRINSDFSQRENRLYDIQKLSEKNKFQLLEYYNKLESLALMMDRCSVTGGNLEKELNSIIGFVKEEDDLVKEISHELLHDCNTSKNVITTSKIEKGYKERRQEIYRQCFLRGEGYVYGFFAWTMYYMYYYLLMDRVMFQKKYSISEITKDDTLISKDIRILNYIEESLKEGNIELCHLLASQLSTDMKHKMKDFISQCESWIRYRVSLQTLRDHSNYLLSSHFGLKK